MSRSPLLLATTWLMACLSVLIAGLAVRLAPIEKAFSWPSVEIWPAAANWTGPVALGLAAASVLLLSVLTGAAREGNRARPFAELIIFFPVIFAFIWFLLPPGPLGIREWIIGAVLVLAAIWLARHCPGPIPGPAWSAGPGSKIIDATLVLFPLVLGLILDNSPDIKASGFSLLLYPLYAFIQLLVFLYIPVTRLRVLGVSNANSTILAALVFALVHWPNPLVMLVTLAGMLIWAHQFQNGRPLWQLAIIMGLTATSFSQFLPDDLTRHVRVGPGYIRSEAVMHLAGRAVEPGQTEPATYIRQIYPDTIGREATNLELKRWLELLSEARRSTWANIFLVSLEHRQRMADSGNPLPPPPETHWTDWPPEWKNRVLNFAGDEYWLGSGSNLEGYVRSLYRDILGREASAPGLAKWVTNLSIGQRKRFAEVLLDLRLQNGQQVFIGMSVEEFRLSN